MWIYPRLKGESKKTYITNRRRDRRSFICLSLHSCCRVILCMHVGVYVFAFSPWACWSLSLHLCSLCMFYVFYFQVVINSLTPYRPEALPFWCLLLFALILSETCTLLSSPLTSSALLILSPAPLSPCEVCDLCNFILPVAGDISQSGSMNIDELIQNTLSKRPDTEISGSHSSNGHPSPT